MNKTIEENLKTKSTVDDENSQHRTLSGILMKDQVIKGEKRKTQVTRKDRYNNSLK